jgi:hypothetical protein
MSDHISLVETEQIEPKIQVILRQTDYTEDQAREKLKAFHYDEVSVIRDYFGIPLKKQTTAPVQSSINQAIYKQLRGHLDGAMKSYRERVENGDAKAKLA